MTIDHHELEESLRAASRRLAYPPTPDPSAWFRTPMRRPARRPALALAMALVLLVSALAVPPVRAAVLDFIQVGIVRIFRPEAAPSLPAAMPTPIASLANVLGQTTLEEAAEASGLPVRIPAALGEPDYVYAQRGNGPVLFMVWEEGGVAAASLTALGEGAFAWKVPGAFVEARVGAHHAIWIAEPHPFFLLAMGGGDMEALLFDAGSVLIWEQGGITYRLEGELSLDEAVRIAETLE